MSSHIQAQTPEEGALVREMCHAGWEPDAALQHIRNTPNCRNMARRGAEATKVDTDTQKAKNEYTGKINTPHVVIVEIPMAPAKELLPNQHRKQSHWSTQSRARKAFRNEAAWQAALMLPHNWQPITGPVSLDIFVHWPKRRRPDLDAAVSSVKAAVDGIADAGVIDDDQQIKKITATHEYGAKSPGCTRLTITEIAQ